MGKKLVIIGVGNVGTAVLNRAITLNLFSEIVLIDIDEKKALGEALDSSHRLGFEFSNTKIRNGKYDECKDADIIIVSAGPSILPTDDLKKLDRLSLVNKNLPVIKEVMSSISKHTKEAIIILITNPLDVMVYFSQNYFGYPKGKVFGTGTMLDSSRLRQIIADFYKIDPKSIGGYMLGEHGNSAFPAWSKVNVGSIPIAEFEKFQRLDREKIANEVVKVAYDVLNLKGHTNYGIATIACTLAKAVVLDEKTIFPVSTTLEGEYGIENVALSLPCLVGKNGIEKRYEISLSENELEKLKESSNSVKNTFFKAMNNGGTK